MERFGVSARRASSLGSLSLALPQDVFDVPFLDGWVSVGPGTG